MVQNRLLVSFAFLLIAFSAQAANVGRSFVVKFKNDADSSTVSVTTSIHSESGEKILVAAFTNAQGSKYIIANSATYDEDLKKFTNEFSLLKREPQSAATLLIADCRLSCVARDDGTCRINLESGALSAEVESVLVETREEESVNSIDLNVYSGKQLSNHADETVKTLEKLQTATQLRPREETLLYSDSQSKSELLVFVEVDQYGNIGQAFRGKDGYVELTSRSGQRAVFELRAPSPVRDFEFKRHLEVETLAYNAAADTVQAKSASVQAILNLKVDSAARELRYDTSIKLDESSLKPDPAQPNYTAGDGLLVIKEEQNGADPSSLKAFWDLAAAQVGDVTKNSSRLQVYKIRTPGTERVIKLRGKSGQRSRLELAESVDPKDEALSALEADFLMAD